MRSFRGSKLLTALAAVTLGTAVSLTAAAPAQAVSGIIVTIGWSALTGSESTKTANAICPAGKFVLGGGADIVGGGNEVRLTAMIPAAPGLPTHSYYAAAMEDGSYAADWTLYTWAICGNPIAGWEVRSNYAAVVPGNSYVHSLAFCTGNKKVVGTGGAVVGGYRFKLIYIIPGGADHITVSTGVAPDENVNATYGAWSYAICADPIGQQVVWAESVSSSINKGLSVACPAGTKVHGTGAKAGSGPGGGSPVVGQLHLNRIGLFGAGALAGVDVAAHEDQTGYAGNWTTTVYAICAP
ncbi:hypothetical protein ACFQZ4_35780 [Catellatospora coxensis]|uniref:Secreted protein n=1 Tax=Catellatospora coxensis TaxID=310354 RepID=A0A8J3P858_9ACTN|nr:hypothetical protein [Catellatospora coxensis]GIG07786.1 hypothetical protein Cco03nite_44860 [Catellatospora coxensis]